MSIFGLHKTKMVDASEALPGRAEQMPVPELHEVLGTPLRPPYPEGTQVAEFALGCFWGAEKQFWQTSGRGVDGRRIRGRLHPQPDIRGGVLRSHRACRGGPRRLRSREDLYAELLKMFWEAHNPTQGMRQGNDIGSPVPVGDLLPLARAAGDRRGVEDQYQKRLSGAGYGEITTEIVPATEFYFAEDYHQQYLSDAKNPNGYCPDHGTGVSCPIGVVKASD